MGRTENSIHEWFEAAAMSATIVTILHPLGWRLIHMLLKEVIEVTYLVIAKSDRNISHFLGR